MDKLIEIISRQRRLQADYGIKYDVMPLDDRVQVIKDMYVAAVQELGEALNETSWKPWTSGGEYINEAMTGEIVDALQFMLNMLFAQYPECSAEQIAVLINDKHRHKVAINRKRMTENYDGVSTKCPNCKRALDEITMLELFDGERYSTRCVCGAEIYDRGTPA